MAEMEEGKGKENVRKGGWTRKIEAGYREQGQREGPHERGWLGRS